MTTEQQIEARLRASAPFLALMTGGVICSETTPEQGITRTTYPSVYAANGLIKPFCVVKERSVVSTGTIRDQGSGAASTRIITEVWLYQDKALGWDNLNTAWTLVYSQLQAWKWSAVSALNWIDGVERGEAQEYSARFKRLDFECYTLKQRVS